MAFRLVETTEYHINSNQLRIDRDTRLFEITLRSDVPETSIVSLLETVLLSLGKVSFSKQQSTLPLFELRATSGDGITYLSLIYLGVGQRNRRILAIHVQKDNSVYQTNNRSSPLLYVTTFIKSFTAKIDTYAKELTDQLLAALASELLLSSHLEQQSRAALRKVGDGFKVAVENMQGGQSDNKDTTSAVISRLLGSRTLYDSVLDPAYVRDLQAYNSRNMITKIMSQAVELDQQADTAELQCARLMAVLKPTFDRCGLRLPKTPAKRLLGSYPLEVPGRKKMISEVSLEMARLIILRARKVIRDSDNNKITATGTAAEKIVTVSAQENLEYSERNQEKGEFLFDYADMNLYEVEVKESHGASFNNNNSTQRSDGEHIGSPTIASKEEADAILRHLQLVQDVTRLAVSQLETWAEEEGRARLARKTVYTLERIEDLRKYKVALLLSLHTRSIRTPLDHDKMKELKARCRVIQDDEPFLYDVEASLNGRKGVLYVTLFHLCFYSESTFISAIASSLTTSLPSDALLKVLPIRALQNVSVSEVITGSSPSLSIALAAGGSLRVEDKAGGVTMFEISVAVNPEMHSRVFEIVQLLIEEKLYDFTVSSSPMTEFTYVADDRRAPISAKTGLGSSPATPATPQTTTAPRQSDAAVCTSHMDANEDIAIITSLSSSSSPTAAMTPQASRPQKSDHSTLSTPANASKQSPLARNIQMFLAQKHSKPSASASVSHDSFTPTIPKPPPLDQVT